MLFEEPLRPIQTGKKEINAAMIVTKEIMDDVRNGVRLPAGPLSVLWWVGTSRLGQTERKELLKLDE